MAITYQNYEWTLAGQSSTVAANPADFPPAGVETSIFVGGFGNNIEIPPFVNEDQFVVIEKFGSTGGVLANIRVAGDGTHRLTNFVPNGFIQIVINSTGYYQDPQNTWQHGISGDAAPYPFGTTDIPPSYVLDPPVYVLPEQTWDIRYTMMNNLPEFIQAYNVTNTPNTLKIPTSTQIAKCHVQYHLFDGPDALICHQLLELGIPINVANVEWYRRILLKSRGLDTATWEHYLEVSQAFRDKEKKYEELYGRQRKA